ncbi:MAG: hypothetical protein MUF86_09175 [Akkermansiaceae bacterium]|jgi:hypothetical protein|nr:hypothetical protein [Akkermansiaceae bacterium]
MGMFDTIHLKSPLICPVCGGQEHSYQTHAFDDVMANYRIGSVVGGALLTGIVQERFWCSACHKVGKSAESPVYLVVWHSILVGLEQDFARAEARLSAVDRLDLIGWLDEAQRNENRRKRRYYGFLNDVRRWHEHLERERNPEPVPEGETAEQAKRRKAFASLWRLPEEILSAPDPLAAIIANNTPSQGENDQDGIWD